MAKVAQLVRVSVCGTECREFESHLSPQCRAAPKGRLFVIDERPKFCYSLGNYNIINVNYYTYG